MGKSAKLVAENKVRFGGNFVQAVNEAHATGSNLMPKSPIPGWSPRVIQHSKRGISVKGPLVTRNTSTNSQASAKTDPLTIIAIAMGFVAFALAVTILVLLI